MNKAIALALLVVGIILLYFGYQEMQSVASQAKEVLTGQPTDNSMWFLVGGAVAVILGLFGLLKKK